MYLNHSPLYLSLTEKELGETGQDLNIWAGNRNHGDTTSIAHKFAFPTAFGQEAGPTLDKLLAFSGTIDQRQITSYSQIPT